MIDIRKLKELVKLMVANELTEVDLRDSEEKVTLRRANPNQEPIVVSAPMAPAMAHAHAAPAMQTGAAGAPAGAPAGAGGASASAPAADPDEGLHRIESPIVGTFFAAANPDSPPFASVGTQVGPDSTVCIVEAMKIFNEIKAETSGTIEKILVKNGDTVEYGQPLFLVRPG